MPEGQVDHVNMTNSYCVMLGRPGTDPLTTVGPFATEDQARAYAAEAHTRSPQVIVDILVNPQNV